MVDGKLAYDVYGDRWSRFTFLIYLNDDFDGGATTFYTPSECRSMRRQMQLRRLQRALCCVLQRAMMQRASDATRARALAAAPHACVLAHGCSSAAATVA